MPAPSLCVVSGTVFDENGVPAVGVTIYLKRVLLNGVLIGTAPIGTASIPQLAGGDHTIQYIEAITSIAGGVVSFTVPQLSTIYMEGNVSGFNNGEIALSIPATATATLESLVAASVIPASGLTVQDDGIALANLIGTLNFGTGLAVVESPTGVATVNASVVDAETIQDALVNFFPDVAPFDWTYDDAGDRVTLAILDATASARGLMSTAYAARLDQLEVGDAPTFAGLTLSGLTPGSVLFVGAADEIAEDNPNLFWDDTANTLRIGGTGGAKISYSTNIILSNNTGTGGTLFSDTGVSQGLVNRSGLHVAANGEYRFSNTANNANSGAWDLGLARRAAGVLRTSNGSTGSGQLLIGSSTDTIAAQLHTLSNAIGVIPLIAEGPAGQTANLQEWRVNALPKLIVTAAGTVQVYNAFTDVSNYERLESGYNTSFAAFAIIANQAGTGAAKNLYLGTEGNASLLFRTNAVTRAYFENSTGHLKFSADNTNDIGANGATRPRDIYAGTAVRAPIFVGMSAGSAVGTIRFESNGVFRFTDSSIADFFRLQFGGTTSSYPALKRSATILQGRLADDSDFCPVQGKLRSHANVTAETPTATHTLRLFDAAGTEYKVLCIAA